MICEVLRIHNLKSFEKSKAEENQSVMKKPHVAKLFVIMIIKYIILIILSHYL